MAIIATIQHRHGAEEYFKAEKMVTAELAVTDDGTDHVYIAFEEGRIEELALKKDITPGHEITDEQIKEAVNKYLEENPIEPGNVTSESIKSALGYTPADEAKIPKNTSDITNDSGFVTNMVNDLANYYLKSETFTRDEINAKLSAIPKFSIQVVTSLPTANISATTVYLLKVNDAAGNLYEEYIYVDGAWEKLGTQRVDLTGYAKLEDIPTKLTELTNDAGFITNTVNNLVNYYSKEDIDKKGFLTEHQDLSGYAKKSTTLAGYGITDGATKEEVNKLSEQIGDQKHDGNYIPNERFIRGIANLRDSEKAKDFEITITNNSGKIIKNAGIAVGLHNTVGVNPDNNNLPFQIYDDVFTEMTGFKFFDEDGEELPYYIESETDCNYIVDKNVKTDQKTMGVIKSSGENYNLLKLSEVTYQSRLQNDVEGILTSNTSNVVSGWIPVEYGKYYTLSLLHDGSRTTVNPNGTSAFLARVNVKKTDGSILVGQRDVLRLMEDGDTIPSSHGTIVMNITDCAEIQIQINTDSSMNIGTYDGLKSYEPMFVSGATAEEAYNNSLNYEYIDGDEEISGGGIVVYNATEARMQISEDDGATWTNICEEITSTPYRILLPDSQNNLFVASNDGRTLYKYTQSDGYMTGTAVIDMATIQESIGTDVEILIGSILAEDSDGNLYLGTYQSAWCCVIMKSPDHGDTWSVVFSSTESQHVHNIYVNTKVTPNEIFIGLDGSGDYVRTYVSKDEGATWSRLDVPYMNREYAFRYAGENFYIGCGERNVLGGATLYKTTDYNDTNAYYPLFDNGQGIRDITNVIADSDDVLIAGGCVGDPVNTEQLFLSEDRGETWKTVLMQPYYKQQIIAGIGLRTFSKKDSQIISESSSGYAMRFVYGNGAKTILAIVNVGDIPTEGKTITLKTGYIANVEQMSKVLTAYENIDGKVADIRICNGYVIDTVSNKRVLTADTEVCNYDTKLGQTSEYKILSKTAYRLNGSVNLGKLSRLNFTKGFTVSMLFRKEDGKNYLEDGTYHVIWQSGDTKLILWYRSLVLMSGTTNIYAKRLYLDDSYLNSVNDDYVRVTAYFTDDDLPFARIYTDNGWSETYDGDGEGVACTEYPITQNFSENDFIIGNVLGSGYADIPNIARIEIYNRVLSHGEIMSLTNGCNLVTDGSRYN